MISTSIEVWVAALLTLAIFSYVIKENIAFRTAEHLVLGAGIGYSVVASIKNLFKLGINPVLDGKYILIVPVALGILLYGQYFKKTQSISKWPMAIIVGTGLGIATRGIIETYILNQILATSMPLFIPTDLFGTFNNILMTVMVILGIMYFYFTKEFTGPVGSVVKMGRYVYLITFGATYASVVLARLGVFIPRLSFLVKTWLGL